MDIHTSPSHKDINALLASVRMLLDRQPPAYGSTRWHALPNDHPDRIGAVWDAAEEWRRYWTPAAIATRLRTELDQYDRVWLQRFKAMTAEVSAVWDAGRYCTGPTWLELQRRRAIPSRGEPSPAEAARIARYTAALAATGELITHTALSIRDAQRSVLDTPKSTPNQRNAA